MAGLVVKAASASDLSKPFCTDKRTFFRKSLRFFKSDEVRQKLILLLANIAGLNGDASQSLSCERVIHSADSGLLTSYALGKFTGITRGYSVDFTSSILWYSFPFPLMMKSISNSSPMP